MDPGLDRESTAALDRLVDFSGRFVGADDRPATNLKRALGAPHILGVGNAQIDRRCHAGPVFDGVAARRGEVVDGLQTLRAALGVGWSSEDEERGAGKGGGDGSGGSH